MVDAPVGCGFADNKKRISAFWQIAGPFCCRAAPFGLGCMRTGDKPAEYAYVVDYEVRLPRGLVGHLYRRLARKNQYPEGTRIVGHLDVGVYTVADHRYLFSAQSVTVLNARQHVGVGLAEGDVGFASRGVFEACADRTAVDQHYFLVGGAYAVRVCRYIGYPA